MTYLTDQAIIKAPMPIEDMFVPITRPLRPQDRPRRLIDVVTVTGRANMANRLIDDAAIFGGSPGGIP